MNHRKTIAKPYADFFALPAIVPVVGQRDALLQQHPALANILTGRAVSCREHGSWPNQAALVAPRHLLADTHADELSGDVLVLNLPALLEPVLIELAARKPAEVGWISLDLRSSSGVLVWEGYLPDRTGYRLLVASGDIAPLLGQSYGEGADFRFVPLLLLAGDSCAAGGFWWDGEDVANSHGVAMCNGENFRAYRVHGEDALTAADEKARRAGVPTPWTQGPWRDEEGFMVVQCEVQVLEKTSSPLD